MADRGLADGAVNHRDAEVEGVATIDAPTQALRPTHCDPRSNRARLHDRWDPDRVIRCVHRSGARDGESHSAFFDGDHPTPTPLHGDLLERAMAMLFVVGLATDDCVRDAVLDALKRGFAVRCAKGVPRHQRLTRRRDEGR